MSGSSTSRSITAPTPRSHSLPMDTIFEKPKPRAVPRESRLPSTLPLWETTLRLPARISGISSTALTLRVRPAAKFITPMLLGPTRRTPASRATASNAAWRAAPSSVPRSAKPSLYTVATGTPARPHSSMAAGTLSAGTMTRAWSTGPGASATLAKAGSPCTRSRPGFTGTTRPAKPCWRRKRWGRPVFFCGSAEAPISATQRGRNRASARDGEDTDTSGPDGSDGAIIASADTTPAPARSSGTGAGALTRINRSAGARLTMAPRTPPHRP